MTKKFSVLFKRQPNGSYYAICPDLPGCFTQGDDLEHAKYMIRDLVTATLDELDELERDEINEYMDGECIYTNINIEV